MKLTFEVNNQILVRTDKNKVVADSRNYLYAEFAFLSEDWNGITKTAIFRKGNKPFKIILDEDNTCLVPWEVLECGTMFVSVFGGDLITTNSLAVSIMGSGYSEGETPSEPTPDVYTQIINMIENMEGNASDEQIAKAVSDYLAENPVNTEVSEDQIVEVVSTYIATNKAELKGDKGEQGGQGEKGDVGEDGVSVTHSWDGTTLTITSASGTSSADLKGDKGDKGESGQNGSDGKSAYEIAIDNGFKGTEEEWLASLHGKDGVDGSNGVDGKDGVDGSNGVDGKDGADGFSPIVTVEQIANGAVITITDENGTTSATVNNGKDSSDVGNVDSLAGKTILCLGDSLMAGDGWAGGFANCVQENHPTVQITNVAVSGATLIQNDAGKYIYKQFQAYYNPDAEVHGEEPDIILFDGGGNDCAYRATIGTGRLDSCYINGVHTTMCDALEYLIYAIKTVYPNTKLLYINTPTSMQWDTESVPSVPTYGVQLEYATAREKVLEKWGIPIADLKKDGNLTSCINSQRAKYYIDSIHLNEAGYRYVSPVIEEALRKLL